MVSSSLGAERALRVSSRAQHGVISMLSQKNSIEKGKIPQCTDKFLLQHSIVGSTRYNAAVGNALMSKSQSLSHAHVSSAESESFTQAVKSHSPLGKCDL